MIRYWPGQFVFIPASLPAICIDVLCLLFVLTVLVTANRQAHSVSDFLYAVFPYVATTFLLREWRRTGEPGQNEVINP